MTTQEKVIRRKQCLLELAEYLQNVSQACKINGVSRQHFYDIKKAYEEQGIEGLREKTRRKPCLKNRVVPEIEAAVIQMAYEYPAYGQTRAVNELRKQGVLVSSGGVSGASGSGPGWSGSESGWSYWRQKRPMRASFIPKRNS